MIKEIKYTGFTAVPSDYECQDGDLAASINIVPEDGQLKIINQPLVIMTLPSESQRVIFIHERQATSTTSSMMRLPIKSFGLTTFQAHPRK